MQKDDVIYRDDAIDALDVLCQEHRYKIPGKRETYSQYNEAWQDALDRAEGAIFNLPSAQPESPEWAQKVELMHSKALKMPYIKKPMAWALYQVWKEYDNE